MIRPELNPYRDRTCKDCGAVITAIFDKRHGIWREPPKYCPDCSKNRLIQDLIRDCSFEKRLLAMDFDNYKTHTRTQEKAVKDLIDYSQKDGESRNIFISGKVGVGKTHLAVSLAKRIIRDSLKRVLFIAGVDLLYQIKKTFDPDCEIATAEITDKYSRAPYLIIDDLGVEKATEWVREVFYLIVNKRYNRCLPTIITTNFNSWDLALKLGDRLISRLLHDALIIKLDGRDYRISK